VTMPPGTGPAATMPASFSLSVFASYAGASASLETTRNKCRFRTTFDAARRKSVYTALREAKTWSTV
jgi:hypothetical protein